VAVAVAMQDAAVLGRLCAAAASQMALMVVAGAATRA
jgi:hypothetical protein